MIAAEFLAAIDEIETKAVRPSTLSYRLANTRACGCPRRYRKIGDHMAQLCESHGHAVIRYHVRCAAHEHRVPR